LYKIKYLTLVFIIFLLQTDCFSQGIGIKGFRSKLGNTAYDYLLSATRPYYIINASTLGKKAALLDVSFTYSKDIKEIPVSFTYGVSDKVDLFINLFPFTQTYNFAGKVVSGFGDIITGVRYQFQESKHFTHAVQTAVKIPTASKTKQMGTGYVDFHIGLGEDYINKKFNYSLGIELDILRRRDFPSANVNVPNIIKNVTDSLKSVYNYKYEPEIILYGGPGYDFSDYVSAYGGIAYSNNFKLKSDGFYLYLGTGIYLSDYISLGLGLDSGLKNENGWSLYTGLSIMF
jgi:hypothetical protein